MKPLICTVLLTSLTAASAANAHQASTGWAHLELASDTGTLLLRLPALYLRAADADGNGSISMSELQESHDGIATLLTQTVRLSAEGAPCATTYLQGTLLQNGAAGVAQDSVPSATGFVALSLSFACPETPRELTMAFDMPRAVTRAYHLFVVARAGNNTHEGLISESSPVWTFRVEPSWARSAQRLWQRGTRLFERLVSR